MVDRATPAWLKLINILHLFSGSAASPQLSSEMPWASCWCLTWPISKVSSTFGTGWVCVTSAPVLLSAQYSFRSMFPLLTNVTQGLSELEFQVYSRKFIICVTWVWIDVLCHGSGQLQANAYCDSPDIVLVGTKADLPDLRDVHGRQARDLADRYGWGSSYLLQFLIWVTNTWLASHCKIMSY